MSEEKFDLNGDPRNNYVNLILNDMKNFNYWMQQRHAFAAPRALRALVFDLPPAGQEALKDVVEKIIKWDRDISVFGTDRLLLENYQKVMQWVWPNILEAHVGAKPRNPQPTTLGA